MAGQQIKRRLENARLPVHLFAGVHGIDPHLARLLPNP
jgi:hypothetical protein